MECLALIWPRFGGAFVFEPFWRRSPTRLSVVILPPTLSMPAQPLRLSCLHHRPCDRVAAVIPSAERWMPSSTRLSEWILTISDRRHGHAKQVCRGDPSQFQSDVGSRAFGRSAQGSERSLRRDVHLAH